jgi:hypothetical protein
MTRLCRQNLFLGGSFMKRTGFLGVSVKALVAGLFAVVLLAAGCEHGPGSSGDEFNEEDFNVTDSVLDSQANQAMMNFLATPDIPMFAEQIKNARDNGFTWSGNLAQIEGSYTGFITGKTGQLGADGSGFEFSLNTKAGNEDALRPAIGFNAVFYFTADDGNLGSSTYNALSGALEGLPSYQGWVLPESSVLTDLGIKVFTMYGAAAKDITDRVSFGLMPDEDKIMFSYGAVMVDRAISNFGQEGQPLLVSAEEELVWSDGTLDGKITGAWWIGKTGSD